MTAAEQDLSDTFTVFNPATGEPVRDLPIHGADHVLHQMERVRSAQVHWAQLPIATRVERLRRVEDVINARMDEIVDVVVKESGKPHVEALLHDVSTVLLTMRYFLSNAERILTPQNIRLTLQRHRRSYINYQPKGVVGVITPWNFPFFMPGSDVAMSLIAGNGVLLKPSEVTPLSALILKECYDEAGMDPDLFRVVTGLGETGAALIAAQPDHVVFTGSVPTGRRVGMACAERMISFTLELGGKAPAIVLDDADIGRTTNAILWGGLANCGQACASVERVYATAGIYDRLVDRLTKKARELRVGEPKRGAVDLGSITWPRQREIVEELVEDARERGARITMGGARAYSERGHFYQPTIIADCSHEMRVMKEEIFGPVVPLMKIRDVEEGVRLANDSHLGLGGYVFTQDADLGQRIAEQLRVGSVMINDVMTHAASPEMPWGGIKQSGLGVVRSDRGLQELCHAQHVNYGRVAPLKRDPYWYPYTKDQHHRLHQLLKGMFGKSLSSRLFRSLMK